MNEWINKQKMRYMPCRVTVWRTYRQQGWILVIVGHSIAKILGYRLTDSQYHILLPVCLSISPLLLDCPAPPVFLSGCQSACLSACKYVGYVLFRYNNDIIFLSWPLGRGTYSTVTVHPLLSSPFSLPFLSLPSSVIHLIFSVLLLCHILLLFFVLFLLYFYFIYLFIYFLFYLI